AHVTEISGVSTEQVVDAGHRLLAVVACARRILEAQAGAAQERSLESRTERAPVVTGRPLEWVHAPLLPGEVRVEPQLFADLALPVGVDARSTEMEERGLPIEVEKSGIVAGRDVRLLEVTPEARFCGGEEHPRRGKHPQASANLLVSVAACGRTGRPIGVLS